MDDILDSLAALRKKLEDAEKINASSIEVGDIVYVSLTEEDGLTLKSGYDTRRKYIVIIGFTPEGMAVGALLINSQVHPLKRSPEMMDCQYPMLLRNYPDILTYNSWLDCSDIFEFSKDRLTEKEAKRKGCLIPEDKDRVLEFLRHTDVIDNVTKRRFGLL